MDTPNVLLADDDPSVLDALGAVLESEGFHVLRAADGREAIESFKEYPVDIALLDLNMPRKGGWDAFERLTTINPLLPVIIITARPDAFRTAMAARAAALMRKPLDIPRLLEAMRTLLAETPEARLERVSGHGSPTRFLG